MALNNPILITDSNGEQRRIQLVSLIGSNGEIINFTHNGIDENIQDQYTPTVFVKANKIIASTTLAAQPSIDDYTFEVVDSSGMSVGNYFIVFSAISNRYSLFTITNISVNTITVDSLIDFAYPIGSNVDAATTNLAVNGSITPQIFGIRGVETGNEVPTTVDITRVVFEFITASAVDLAKFGDLFALTNGLLLRHRNDEYRNIISFKTNGEIAGTMYDWTPYSSTNPVQGVDGFVSRLTFAGQNKVGVVKRLAPGEDLEVIVQDDLSGITKINLMFEGHEVE